MSMTPRDFCYWLQGFFELSDIDGHGDLVLHQDDVKIIREHLDLVFQTTMPSLPLLSDSVWTNGDQKPLLTFPGNQPSC